MTNKNTILVGNGPSAIKTENGSIIDSFSTVIRFNNFIIDGYEKYVGTKADIWAVNIGYLFRKDIFWTQKYKQPTTIIFSIFSLHQYENYTDCLNIKLKENEKLCDINIAKWGDCYYNKTNKIWPSTGLLCIMQFKPCFITGFDCFMSNKHHYGDNMCFKTHHDGNNIEYPIINKLINDGELKIL